ncbi:TerC/Alx family metal homeostasis membrane protein [Actinomadura sp. HBU206391]|uniref:TerC/Alx family metal homeostasis membrane protein n=1 Tax=Actinomadura sp. HBU206391 TaxID=2731692 RepID=UPI00164F95E0|nr:TerC/Alx family metal homeostasis membrane protein [Actinomadura sp. HBU206391]MBC6463447.1 TerC/Alx family metal homeostasis membrane protein [Actinomadura sp. HBU206391]
MNVPLWIWALTLVGLTLLIIGDLIWVDRTGAKQFSSHQAAFWSVFYITLAMLFGLGILAFAGGDYAAQFYAGFVTEKSLSVDNLFVFYVIMTRFAVPKQSQHRVLMLGVVLALILRGIFIAIGAAAIAQFQWVFFIFGAFLIWTAIGLVRTSHDEQHVAENALLRWSRRVLPTTDAYHGSKISIKQQGKRLFTPLFIVIIAIGSTDLLFALDSIPAIFGLTKEPYLVFTTNAFALMGLVQLYFLLGGLVRRLVYLSHGLAAILGFIGVKLVLEALHGYHVSWAPVIPIWLSLSIIGGTLVVTTVASLVKIRRDSAAGSPAEEGDEKDGTVAAVD